MTVRSGSRGKGVAARHVLIVTARFPPLMGGIETHVAEVSARLAADGSVPQRIVTADPTGALPRHDVVNDVDVYRVRAFPRHRDWIFAPGMLRHIWRRDTAVVHCQGVHTLMPVLAMTACTVRRVPYIVTFHTGGHSDDRRHGFRRRQWQLLAPLLRRASALIAVSRHEIDLFSEVLGIPSDRFKLIRNGTELPSPSGEVPARAHPGPRVVSLGRLERYKGHHRAIAALPELRRRRPGAFLTVVGTGPYEDELRKQADALGVGDVVEFTSFARDERARLADLLLDSQLVVLLSDYEAHPVAIMESLGLGCRVLGLRAAGLIELIDDGLISGVGPDADGREVAAAMDAAIDAPVSAVMLPTWDDCAKAVAETYHEVLDR